MYTTPHKFWMVKGAGPTNFRHDSRREAEAEAARLARCSPGQQFFVLEAVAVHRAIETERISLDNLDEQGEIPF